MSCIISTGGTGTGLVLVLALCWIVHRFGQDMMDGAPVAQAPIRENIDMNCDPCTPSISALMLGVHPAPSIQMRSVASAGCGVAQTTSS